MRREHGAATGRRRQSVALSIKSSRMGAARGQSSRRRRAHWGKVMDKREAGSDAHSNAKKHARAIIHIDLDCFYAQVEMVAEPELRDKPLGIQQKNIIVTCNYPARARGVGKLQRLKSAFEACPELVIRNGSDLKRYREASEKILSQLKTFTPRVERLGLDEFFLDVTDVLRAPPEGLDLEDEELFGANEGFAPHLYRGDKKLILVEVRSTVTQQLLRLISMAILSLGDMGLRPAQSLMSPPAPKKLSIAGADAGGGFSLGSRLAQKIRGRLYSVLGYTASAGISVSKMIAKLSGELHKPNQQTTMLPAYVTEFLSALRVRKLPGCGYSSARKLKELDIEYVHQLRQVSQKKLIYVLGDQIGARLYRLCRGDDPSPVVLREKEKTMSEEDSFLGSDHPADVESRISRLLHDLLDRVDTRFCRHGDLPSLIRLTIRDRLLWRQEQQASSGSRNRRTDVEVGTFHPTESKQREDRLIGILMQLFFKLVSDSKRFHLTLLNVAVARFQPHGGGNGRQLGIQSFFSENTATGRTRQSFSLEPRSSKSTAQHSTALCGAERLLVPTILQAATIQPSSKRNRKSSVIATTATRNIVNEHNSRSSSSRSSRSSEALKGSPSDSKKKVVVTAKDIDDLFDL
eukprot:jgi/Bigna1/132461/aug1.17_g7169